MSVEHINRSNDAWTNFCKFVDFTKQEGVTNDTIAKFEATNEAHNGFSLERSVNDKIHKFRRSESAKTFNNQIRDQFLKTVCDLFGLESNQTDRLPPEIKKALVLGDYGKGRPLSARRIKAVSAAIEKWDGCPPRFMVSNSVQKRNLKDIQSALDAVFRNNDKYDEIVSQLRSDVQRNSGADARFTTQEEIEFQNNPNSQYARKGVVTFMLNGKQYPAGVSEEGPTAEEIENFVKEQFPVDPPNQDAEKLRKMLVSFCHQGAFTLGVMDITSKGGVIGAGASSCCNVSNIVRSPDMKSYDVIVQQKFFAVTGLKSSKNGSPVVPFDPMKPGECTVTTTYRVSMKKGRPVVSYAKKPEVQAKFFKPISAESFKNQASEFAREHLNEILGKVRSDTLTWWNTLGLDEQNSELEEISNSTSEAFLERGNAFTIENLAADLAGRYQFAQM